MTRPPSTHTRLTQQQEHPAPSSVKTPHNPKPKFILRQLLILPIKIYKVCLSPLLGRNCRFYPSCSSYSMEAIERHGCLKGLLLSIKRICKCHPFNPGGVDHVPGHEPEYMESEHNE